MNYLLDTNPCIRYLTGRSSSLCRRIDQAGDAQLAVCSVVKAELMFGAMKSTSPGRTLDLQRRFLSRFVSFPFDDQAAQAYARIRADLEKTRQTHRSE